MKKQTAGGGKLQGGEDIKEEDQSKDTHWHELEGGGHRSYSLDDHHMHDITSQ